MVLVTVAAVLISYAVVFAAFYVERGVALRRSVEGALAQRIVDNAERLRETPPEGRSDAIAQFREFGFRYGASPRPPGAGQFRLFNLRYSVSPTPLVAAPNAQGEAGARLARGISQQFDGAVHARSRPAPPRSASDWVIRDERRRHRHDDAPTQASSLDEASPPETEVQVSLELSPGSWLNAYTRVPNPRPPPIAVWAGALSAAFLVGLGAALVSSQIGRPLAKLTSAAQALGSGQLDVAADVSGPDDVRRAASAFNTMAGRLGSQLTRQRQMLWALSHDLRTPITALKLRAELIDDDATKTRLLAPIEEIERLTEQALALARAGASEEKRTAVDLADVARTLCGELQDIGVNIRADADAPVMATCRPSEIARAMRNLAENAAKYGGGGVMRVFSEGADAVIEVADDGPGVAADQLDKLTAPFFRADEARSGGDGAGLGLAITQAIVEAHGGRLVLANASPRGFIARIVLPG
jgi:signal transduction histidine kinase